ncbi:MULTISPECIES: DUF1501 domain-containing protein [Corallincola]|uniref:DUF1501 domain-containing protein n=3 Tax=Corallincola TaxID=1775176 RepID=A0A368NS34_9GAMM|nr:MULTISPECIES: DUF1501 domain-containing protein [Corallincola]RCU52920.1 DUF1501 domain-containing protein [Corallincola holothuriorum]TAA47926.1 DUF1501 domain-containing protein [Corallincola spongiicola]TCI01177.1 DUF1501 domain-containing protein [Corallincola luteus]
MKTKMSRRDFIIQSAQSAAVATAAVSIGLPGLLQAAEMQNADAGDDYKALVYIFLAGGNDSFNMVAPKEDGVLRTRYEESRQNAALAKEDLVALNLSEPPQIYNDESYDGFGMHPQCTDMADMFNAGEMGVICNVGNLHEPTSREEFLSGTVTLPPQLFSHSDQQRQYQSEPTSRFSYGWGGRVAELVSDRNPDSKVSPLISVAGLNPFQVSRDSEVNTYVLSDKGQVSLRGFFAEREEMVEAYMNAGSSHLMSEKYQQTFRSGITAGAVVADAFSIAEANNTDYDGIFSATGADTTTVGRQLKTVAKMIAGRASSTNQRPIFFVKMGGFDTHQNILADHSALMEDLNAALKSFRDALVSQNDFDKVLSYVGSEFGRTFTPNGNDAGAGTDHGWGGHALVLGGAVNGSRFFGTHPDFQMGQGLDADKNKGRGRWIPTTATSQCSAVLAHWLGTPMDELSSVFPSMTNFPDPFAESTNLNFLNMGDA